MPLPRAAVAALTALALGACASPAPAPPAPAPSATGPADVAGALFDARGRHYCTGTVVGRDLVLTAAHCVRKGMTFAPRYHDGLSPLGRWTVTRAFTSAAWRDGRDPDHDLAFLRTAPDGTAHLGDRAGVARLDFGPRHRTPVTVVGYPSSADAPVRRTGTATPYSPTQFRLAGPRLTVGTSGSAFFSGGRVIAVLGGHLGGGTEPTVSYATILRSPAESLYDRATGRG